MDTFWCHLGQVIGAFFCIAVIFGLGMLVCNVIHTIWETKSDTNNIRHIKSELFHLRHEFKEFAEWVKSEDVDIDEAAEATK